MGYFSNAWEGAAYQERWCVRCVHWSDEHGCPCWLAHLSRNADEANNAKSILHKMIPFDGIHNGKCEFFRPGKPPKPWRIEAAEWLEGKLRGATLAGDRELLRRLARELWRDAEMDRVRP